MTVSLFLRPCISTHPRTHIQNNKAWRTKPKNLGFSMTNSPNSHVEGVWFHTHTVVVEAQAAATHFLTHPWLVAGDALASTTLPRATPHRNVVVAPITKIPNRWG